MSRTRRIPGSILLVTLAAAAGWVGTSASIAVLSAQTSFGIPQPKAQAQPKAQTSLQKVQPSAKKIHFDQMKSRAMGSKPGGQPGSESNALLERLKRKYVSRIESQNARVQAMFGRLPVPPTGGGRKKGPPPGMHAPGTGPAPMKPPADPCEGRPLEIRAIQTTPPLEPGEKVFIDGCGFGYPTDPAPAQVFLFGDGFPGGRLKLDLEGTLPMGILARVPMKQGVPDMPTAKLQVVRGSKFSNQMDVGGFRATRDVKLLLPGDVDVTCYHPRAQMECQLASTSGGSFAAKHAITTRGWEALNLDCEDVLDLAKADTAKDETDTYTVKSLTNGWVLGGYSWSWRPEDEGYVMAPVGFAQGSKSSTIKMKWGLYANYCRGPRDSDVRYRVDLYAVGPRGVPHNQPHN
jgi:hypothetical protein